MSRASAGIGSVLGAVAGGFGGFALAGNSSIVPGRYESRAIVAGGLLGAFVGAMVGASPGAPAQTGVSGPPIDISRFP